MSIEDIESERWLVNRLERSGAKVLSIWSVHGLDLARLQPDVASWPLPKLAMVKDTPLGAADFAFYHSFGAWRLKDGRPILVDGVPQHDPPRPGLSMEEQVDAVLYLAR